TLRDFTMFHDIPKIGIGNGAHYITILSGGSLIQHVEGHKAAHQVVFNGLYRGCLAPSDHHQMMFPFDIPKEKYKILAHSKYFQSPTYLNGKNEERDIPENFVEPEIVEYNHLP